MKKLLIIPARSGSKRIKNKNIKIFFNKPIIYYSINQSLKSKLFHKIHVSTDCKNIAKIVEKKIKIDFLRPKKLAKDNIGLMDVFKFVVKKYKSIGHIFSEIWFLSACSPLIDKQDLIKANKDFKSGSKHNSLLAVTEYSPPIQWAFKQNSNKILIPINKKKQKERSQNLQKSYYDTGTFGIFNQEVFYKNKKPIFKSFLLPRTKGIDIDNIEEWEFAKKIFKLKKLNLYSL